MSLTKTEIIDQIEVIENGTVQVRTAIVITDDDAEISRAFHRHVVVPGQDYNQESAKVQAICAAVHTPEVVSAYEAQQQKNQGSPQ